MSSSIEFLKNATIPDYVPEPEPTPVEPEIQEEVKPVEPKDRIIWFFLPVLIFPHILLMAYVFQMMLSVYFGCWFYFCAIILLLIATILEIHWVKKYSFCVCIAGAAVFLFLGLYITIADYSTIKPSLRPALNLTSCLVLCFLNLLSIWPFLVLSGYRERRENEAKKVASNEEENEKLNIKN